MIHHTLHGPPARRISVIQIPRAQVSRLGSISSQAWIAGPNTTALNSWVPLHDLAATLASNYSSLTPDSWQAILLQRQQQAGDQTPGTLTYTPAPSPPSGATIGAPWNSWSTSGCNPQAGSLLSTGVVSPASAASTGATMAAATTGGSSRDWIIAAGILGALASLMYLKQATKGK